jgi:hypothetical protein
VKVSLELRAVVAGRCDYRCEYCCIHEDDVGLPHEVDHVISRQHGGGDDLGNLALACRYCNRLKGPNLASLDFVGKLTRLYNPRTDSWQDHFRFKGAVIEPLTKVGEATTRLLRMNVDDRVKERAALQSVGRIPRN